MLKKIILLSLILISSLIASENESGNESENLSSLSKKGTKWYGLDLSFSSNRMLEEDSRINTFSFITITRFYPANNFILGPSFQFSRSVYRENEYKRSINNYDFGMEIGFSVNVNNKIMPYLILSPVLDLAVSDANIFRYGYSSEKETETTFEAKAKLGCLIYLNDYVGLQLEPNYELISEEEVYSFGFTIGFTFSFNRRIFSTSSTSLTKTSIFELLFW